MVKRESQLSRLVAIGIIFILIFANLACSKPQRKPEQSKGKESNEKTTPKELTQLQSSLEQVFEALRPTQPGTATQKPPTPSESKQSGQAGKQQGESKEQDKSEQKDEQKDEDKNKDKQMTNQKPGQPGGQGGQQPGQAPPGQIDWVKQEQQLEQIHQQWNTYEPKAMKAGARLEIVTGFEEQLNVLTAKVMARDRYGAQLAANRAAQYIPDFLQLYGTNPSPDLSRLRYLNRDVMLKVDANDWVGAEKDLAEMPPIWSRVRSEAKGEEEYETNKVDFSLTDLNQAVKTRDKALVRIKADIVERNLTTLSKFLEKESQVKSGEK